MTNTWYMLTQIHIPIPVSIKLETILDSACVVPCSHPLSLFYPEPLKCSAIYIFIPDPGFPLIIIYGPRTYAKMSAEN